MTAQPTTPITTPPLAPQPPTNGAPQPTYPQAPLPVLPAPRRSTGTTAGIVAAVLVVLGGLGVGALVLFGHRTVDPQSVEQEIVRITRSAVQVVPADVRCPADIEARTGGVFACTASVDQQPVTYTVRQDDDRGHLTVTYDRL